MSVTFLSTLSIILAEVVLVLLGLAIFLFIKLRSAKKTNAESKPETSKDTQDASSGDVLAYINELVLLTEGKLKENEAKENDTTQQPFSTRLAVLRSEVNILEHQLNNPDSTSHWDFVVKEYSNSSSQGDASQKEKIYQARISNLEEIKNMYLKLQEDYKESLETIKKLQGLTDGENNTDELKNTIKELEEKILESQKKFDAENARLNSIIEEAKQGGSESVGDSEALAEVANVKEENEFLVTQIQHLLSQEVTASKSMMENIGSLEQQLEEKEKECEGLRSQLK